MTNIIIGIIVFLLCKEYIITNDSFIISGIFISLLLFSINSFSAFLLEINDSVRQNIISTLQTDDKDLKEIFEQLKIISLLQIDKHVLLEDTFDLPTDEDANPLLERL